MFPWIPGEAHMMRAVFVVSTFAFAACGKPASAPSTQTHVLPPGGSTVISIASEEQRLVTFGFEVGSPSWDATADCPEMNTGSEDSPFILQICGELRDANVAPDAPFAASFKGMYGGGVGFDPKDGVIRVRLTNHAEVEMTFLVEIDPE